MGLSCNPSFIGDRLLASVACSILCLALIVSAQERPFQGGTVYLGFIEDDRRELAKNDAANPATQRVTIPVFSRDASGWKRLDELPAKARWTVAFDGNNLGEVESQPSPAPEVVVNPNPVEASTYVHEVHAILTPAGKVPTIGEPNGRFSGAFGGAVRRPLVVVSKPNFQDPDGWKPATTLPAGLVRPVLSAFRQSYPHVRQCDAQGEPLKQDWNIRDSELSIVKTYASNKGSFLVKTQLKHRRCVFDVSGKNLTSLEGTQWFFVDSDRSAHGFGNDLELVDAGDYDSDGSSEVVFFFGDAETGEEGYILFWQDFRKKVTATWVYR